MNSYRHLIVYRRDKLEEFVPHNYVIQVLDAIQLEVVKTVEIVEVKLYHFFFFFSFFFL